MKKYIAVAALIAAGSAFANAADITTDLTFTDTEWIGGKTVTVSNTDVWSVEDGYELKSWELSFTFTGNTQANKWGSTILATGDNAYLGDSGDGYLGGFQIRWNNGETNNDGKIYVKWGKEATGVNQRFDVVGEKVSYDVSQTLSFALSYTYETKTLSVVVSDNNGTTLGSASQVVLRDVSFPTLTNQGGGVTIPEAWSYSDLKGSVTVAQLPEPSAFGLLAGLGALALVASRRRRK